MTSLVNRACPSSEDFLYWPPEEINQYKNWCEIGVKQHKRRLNKVVNKQKAFKNRN